MATNNATIDPKTGLKSFFGVTEWYPETPQEILEIKLAIINFIDQKDPEEFVGGEEWAVLKRLLKTTCTYSWNQFVSFMSTYHADAPVTLHDLWGTADDIRTELMWLELTA